MHGNVCNGFKGDISIRGSMHRIAMFDLVFGETMKPSTTIWKYEIPIADLVEICMPEGAVVLHAGVQHDIPVMWARVDPAARMVVRKFRVAGTGHALEPEVGEHLGTFLLNGGQLVVHVFEETS